jgi:hypothetical protein
MSIATLKKKTNSKYNNLSVGYKNFSLNGTTRLQGYVGQTMLSRSLPRTLARGNTFRGHGSNNGEYYKGTNPDGIVSGLVNYNDNSVIKLSTLGTYGLLETKYRWTRRPMPYSSTKTDINIQQDYITKVKNVEINCINKTNGSDFKKNIPAKTSNELYKKYMTTSYHNINLIQNKCNITKDEQPNSQGLKLIGINNKCVNIDIDNKNNSYKNIKNTSGPPLPTK